MKIKLPKEIAQEHSIKAIDSFSKVWNKIHNFSLDAIIGYLKTHIIESKEEELAKQYFDAENHKARLEHAKTSYNGMVMAMSEKIAELETALEEKDRIIDNILRK